MESKDYDELHSRLHDGMSRFLSGKKRRDHDLQERTSSFSCKR